MSTKRPLEIIPRIAGLSFALLIATTSMAVAQNYGRQATEARLWLPMGIATDSAGRLYIADGTTVRSVATDGTIKSLTGNDCGAHHLPGVCAPEGVAVDVSGNVYVADGYCRIRR